MTRSEIDQILKDEMKWARRERRRMPFAHGSMQGFSPRVTIFGPAAGQVAHLPVEWASDKEKRATMYRVARTAAVTHARAVMIVSDVTSTNSAKLAKHFGWEEPNAKDPASIDRFRQRYNAIYKGGMVNTLPPHLWNHSIWVSIKGPEVGPSTLTLNYIDDHGEVLFDPFDKAEVSKAMFLMLEDFWKIPEDDPGIQAMLNLGKIFNL